MRSPPARRLRCGGGQKADAEVQVVADAHPPGAKCGQAAVASDVRPGACLGAQHGVGAGPIPASTSRACPYSITTSATALRRTQSGSGRAGARRRRCRRQSARPCASSAACAAGPSSVAPSVAPSLSRLPATRPVIMPDRSRRRRSGQDRDAGLRGSSTIRGRPVDGRWSRPTVGRRLSPGGPAPCKSAHRASRARSALGRRPCGSSDLGDDGALQLSARDPGRAARSSTDTPLASADSNPLWSVPKPWAIVLSAPRSRGLMMAESPPDQPSPHQPATESPRRLLRTQHPVPVIVRRAAGLER